MVNPFVLNSDELLSVFDDAGRKKYNTFVL